MTALIAVLLITSALGFAVWAADRQRSRYGLLLPAGVALVAGVLLWLVLVAAGLSYSPGVHWLSWLLPMAAGLVAALIVTRRLGRQRTNDDDARYARTLQNR